MAAAEEVVAERMWNYLAPSGDKKVRFGGILVAY